MNPVLTILVPTYNESNNITPLVKRVRAALDLEGEEGYDSNWYEILFVDDSDDSTPQIIQQWTYEDARVRLDHRPKNRRTGLATAVVEGFQNSKGTYICCLDSDLQHPPEVIVSLLQKIIAKNADIAVASRYTKGGSAEGLQTKTRKAISHGLRYTSHFLLPRTRKTSDPGGGFFLFHKDVIDGVSLKPKGFKILLELLVRGKHSRVVDIPYVFQTREHDESKATLDQGLLILQHLRYLFFDVPDSNRFLKFAIVGGSGVIVNLITLAILVELVNVNPSLGWLGAIFVSMTSNFFLNNVLTYGDTVVRSATDLLQKYASFIGGSAIGLLVNYVIYHGLLEANIFYLIAALCGILGGMIFNYFIAQNWVWKPKSRHTSQSNLMQADQSKVKRNFAIVGGVLPLLVILLSIVIYTTIANSSWVLTGILLLAFLIIVEGMFTIYIMLYTWDNPERIDASVSPREYAEPAWSFTALLPARHEADVIGETIRAVANIDYPEHKKEAFVICREDDQETIEAARTAIQEIGAPNIRVLVFDGDPINKPHGLNIGLSKTNHEVVGIFDSEDEPHRDIYNVVNTVMVNEHADIVQSGVQLMNYRSNWYSLFNVLEYFFWFKSALHFCADIGFIPLGGNTVFFKSSWLSHVGGWDEKCLTEDADVGIRLSLEGAKTRVVYDANHVTQEETPPTLGSFIKQRTRWNQGFLQILLKRDWLKISQVSQLLLGLYILVSPVLQGCLFLFIPLAIYIIFFLDAPVLVAMLANIPLFILFLQVIVYNIGLYEFTNEYKLKYAWWLPFAALLYYIPFNLVLSLSAFRGVWRILRSQNSWEKTQHVNAHRAHQSAHLATSKR